MELSASELKQIKKASKGPFLTRNEFLDRHPELSLVTLDRHA